MQPFDFLKSERGKELREAEAASVLNAYDRAQPVASLFPQPPPDHFPSIDPRGNFQAGTFTYGVDGDTRPSDEYLAHLIGELTRLGIKVITVGPDAPRLIGKREAIGVDLMAALKRVKPWLLDYCLETGYAPMRLMLPPVPPEASRPIEWVESVDQMGQTCLGIDLPKSYVMWRYLYGHDRHTWHSASGYEWEERFYPEPANRFRPRNPIPWWKRKPASGSAPASAPAGGSSGRTAF